MINGVTEIVITKADVLDSMKEIRYCDKYKINDQVTEFVPYQMEDQSLKPVYENLAGWLTDITSFSGHEQLPEKLISYIQKISEITHIPVTFVSNGPHRNQLLEILKKV